MFIVIVVIAIWGLLMLSSCLVEYKYYQSVKLYEPEVWAKLGSPKFLMAPFVFISPKGAEILRGASNTTVCELAKKHRKFGILFLSYVVAVLIVSIIYFKTAI